jgi:hypothetical protein
MFQQINHLEIVPHHIRSSYIALTLIHKCKVLLQPYAHKMGLFIFDAMAILLLP